MKPFVLDVELINEDFFENTRLLGVVARLENYKFCLQVNHTLGFDFRMDPTIDIIIKKTISTKKNQPNSKTYHFDVYSDEDKLANTNHYIYVNMREGEYLLPEFKHMDFLWLMKGDYIEEEKVDHIKETLRNMRGIQLVAELTNEQFKNKGNLAF
ncbi:MAG: IPExxxVDY family protein [Sediminibacterium sp.]|jgi:hypothetical protein|nr:IPExxxVDY family protein [Sediminibacterium sp.]